jgi:hypothetical protein
VAISEYASKVYTPVSTEHGRCAENLIDMMVNMSKTCTFKKNPDRHLFQQVRCKLNAARSALVVNETNPMFEIADQLDPSITNKVVGRMLNEKIHTRMLSIPWESDRTVESFLACIALLQEYFDGEINLHINTQVPYSIHDTAPSFFAFTMEFEPVRFGVIWKGVFYYAKVDTKYFIPETILIWLDLRLEFVDAASENRLHQAIVDPESVVQTNEFYKFIYTADSDDERDEDTVNLKHLDTISALM